MPRLSFPRKTEARRAKGMCPRSGPAHGRDPGVGLQAQGTGAASQIGAQSMCRDGRGCYWLSGTALRALGVLGLR